MPRVTKLVDCRRMTDAAIARWPEKREQYEALYAEEVAHHAEAAQRRQLNALGRAAADFMARGGS